MLTIVLVPVGPTEYSPKEELLGINNPALSGEGITQADSIAESLRPTVLEAVFSGPLKRQTVTAKRIASPHSLPVRTDKSLMDVNYGRLSGKAWSSIRREEEDLVNRLMKAPRKFRFPSGEKLKKSWKRLQSFSQYLLGNFGVGHVVVVADDFVIAMLTSLISNKEFISLEPWEGSKGGLTILQCDTGTCKIAMLRGKRITE